MRHGRDRDASLDDLCQAGRYILQLVLQFAKINLTTNVKHVYFQDVFMVIKVLTTIDSNFLGTDHILAKQRIESRECSLSIRFRQMQFKKLMSEAFFFGARKTMIRTHASSVSFADLRLPVC